MKFIILLVGWFLFQGGIADYEYIKDQYVCEPPYFSDGFMDSCEEKCMPYYDELPYADDFCRLESCTFRNGRPYMCNTSCGDAYYEQNMSWLVEPCVEVKNWEVESK